MANQEKVLIVEDEPNALIGLAELVSGWGYRTETARDGVEALDRVQTWQPGIIVTDLKMPRMDGLELLERLGELKQDQAVILLTAQGSIQLAVEAMKMGAYDFIQKPIDPTRLRTILANANRQRDTQRELEVTRRKLRDKGALGSLVGSSKKMQELFGLIERVATSNVSVLITGESGTGKELVARTLHELSPRKIKPFVAVNCAAIPETLIESEIFGHEKGAFTGAVERRSGCFELAEEGTLLLDEIGEMPIGTQAKLLRVLEDHKLRRLGSKVESPVDVRVLAATNKEPELAVANGELRGDLYYRLNVFNIHMPPLREHKDDIPAIAESLLQDMNRKHDRHVSGFDSEMLARLMAYDWPGNVRELRNTLERAVILCGEGELEPRHLPPNFGSKQLRLSHDNSSMVQVEVGTTVDEAERRLILKTLESTGNNKTRAAEILGISLKTLHNKLKEYGTATSGMDALEQ
ncbi:sigma-54-dependent transcriptional regulator [Acidipila rosea]|uniref:Two component Fis family sigma54 specific transcriptional regulator n=1 Tax=Acidipila rosea TaxID=768535 RepID=A0A4R1L6E5_9BACT|nr:sigma-54 dependent transcriptional regulator [Acidipila rosea]MBW4026853.1 sigma-54-dependent Fis family transcriptional regulator [Acidobacteriota bacterium]MBW4043432.1 sigma-54-dependent Fis family transcriptional regulator [Acidobacteriota bacterium]TCK73735.1 two component Fis family sigma54 specific transcriptional regulator [Acidipila rosea]